MKRVLIITYYWPPAGGPGVQRWLKFATYLPAFGVEPIMYIPSNPHYPIIDENISEEIPKDISILSQPIKEPYRFAKWFSKSKTQKMSRGVISSKKMTAMEKLLLWIRGNFFIPDARIGWVKPSVEYLKSYLKENPVDAIVTTGPPHSLHLIGEALQKATTIPWLADFRDPWTTIHYHKDLQLTKSSAKRHLQLEQQILNAATAITVTSPGTKAEFEGKTDTPIHLVTNGYEPVEDISSNLDSQFTLSHIGSLLTDRNPHILWEVLSELSTENQLFKKDLKIQLAGTISEQVIESIKVKGLKDNLNVLGYVSHRKALQLQHNSHVLLLIEMNRSETTAILPGKLFEYLAAKRPILALGPEGSDIETILKQTNGGYFSTYAEKEKLKHTILQYYKRYQEGTLKIDSKGVERFTRKAVSKTMADILQGL
ncbi:glycosyltransferase family protein [Luteirhabdus pelagi]|uniref:glycosyl transferase family 1 n=1 Tax=Luteirhabdus pelagi TaxID=2792783 RepID=UPI001939E2F3|nr:glycosyl transferase family 1 [Luteirhabdus pelagi]